MSATIIRNFEFLYKNLKSNYETSFPYLKDYTEKFDSSILNFINKLKNNLYIEKRPEIIFPLLPFLYDILTHPKKNYDNLEYDLYDVEYKYYGDSTFKKYLINSNPIYLIHRNNPEFSQFTEYSWELKYKNPENEIEQTIYSLNGENEASDLILSRIQGIKNKNQYIAYCKIVKSLWPIDHKIQITKKRRNDTIEESMETEDTSDESETDELL